MSYKILHFADLHLDASFAGQGYPVEYGNERRLDLRAALTRILARARELKVNAVTIGGDLFVQEYLLPETADFIQQQLALLAPIRVIIAPGGKDPFTNESSYARLNWSENVDIFYQSKLTHLELDADIHLWGACNPPARGHKLFDNFQPKKGINILLLYALRGRSNSETYTISNEEVQKAGFRFALLGGEHAAEILPTKQPVCIFPGSPEPLSPSEENNLHQVVFADVDGENIRVKPISLQQWHYHTIELDLTTCTSNAEAARCIDAALEAEIIKTPHSAITVALSGQFNFDLNISSMHQLVQTPAFFRLESHFGLSYELEQLAREQTVRGLVVQRFLDRIRNAANESERCQQLTALHFALQALDGKQVSLYEIKAT